VIGGGDSAVEESIFLTKFVRQVYLVHRRDELRAAAIAQERAFANPKIEIVWSSIPKEIRGADGVTALEVEHVKTGKRRELPVNGVFIFIGQTPNTAWLSDTVKLDEAGYIVTDELLHTELPGVFACGDAHANHLKQIAAATGEGALAAMQAQHYLDALDHPATADQDLASGPAGEIDPSAADAPNATAAQPQQR
jgi:thioredoxin reductase (NADPH)